MSKPRIFLCYSHEDRAFADQLVEDLVKAEMSVWIDKVKLLVGDSLIEKISKAIDEQDFVVAILSQSSVKSNWVQKELEWAMTKEIKHRKVVVLPVLKDDCEDELPSFLRFKIWADCRGEKYNEGIAKLIRSIKTRTEVSLSPEEKSHTGLLKGSDTTWIKIPLTEPTLKQPAASPHRVIRRQRKRSPYYRRAFGIGLMVILVFIISFSTQWLFFTVPGLTLITTMNGNLIELSILVNHTFSMWGIIPTLGIGGMIIITVGAGNTALLALTFRYFTEEKSILPFPLILAAFIQYIIVTGDAFNSILAEFHILLLWLITFFVILIIEIEKWCWR